MIRQLAQRGARLPDAIAVITVSTTLQAVAQILFALLGLVLFGAYATHGTRTDLHNPCRSLPQFYRSLSSYSIGGNGADCSEDSYGWRR